MDENGGLNNHERHDIGYFQETRHSAHFLVRNIISKSIFDRIFSSFDIEFEVRRIEVQVAANEFFVDNDFKNVIHGVKFHFVWANYNRIKIFKLQKENKDGAIDVVELSNNLEAVFFWDNFLDREHIVGENDHKKDLQTVISKIERYICEIFVGKVVFVGYLHHFTDNIKEMVFKGGHGIFFVDAII